MSIFILVLFKYYIYNFLVFFCNTDNGVAQKQL